MTTALHIFYQRNRLPGPSHNPHIHFFFFTASCTSCDSVCTDGTFTMKGFPPLLEHLCPLFLEAKTARSKQGLDPNPDLSCHECRAGSEQKLNATHIPLWEAAPPLSTLLTDVSTEGGSSHILTQCCSILPTLNSQVFPSEQRAKLNAGARQKERRNLWWSLKEKEVGGSAVQWF